MPVKSLEPGVVRRRFDEDVTAARDRAVDYLRKKGLIRLDDLVEQLTTEGQSEDAISSALMDLIVSGEASLDADRRLSLHK